MKRIKIQILLIFAFIFLFYCGSLPAAGLEWHYSESEAFFEANAQGKKIIMLAGSDSCIYCISMKYGVFLTEDPPIKELLENNFILWYSNVDTSSEHYKYLADYPGSTYGIPLICVIDPESENIYEDRTMGAQNSSVFYNRLLEHLPEPEPETSTWTLISLNRQPDNPSVASVLEPIMDNLISVWAYHENEWRVFDPDNSIFSDLKNMECGVGYWLNYTGEIDTGSDLTFTGSEETVSVKLSAGWNLIGYNSSVVKNLPDAVSSIEGKYISIWAYEKGKWQVYDPLNPLFSDLEEMKPGKGYWIKAGSDCEWCCD